MDRVKFVFLAALQLFPNNFAFLFVRNVLFLVFCSQKSNYNLIRIINIINYRKTFKTSCPAVLKIQNVYRNGIKRINLSLKMI